MRNLLNCTDERDYVKCLSKLQAALACRGYPKSLLVDVPYDSAKRKMMLSRISARFSGSSGVAQSQSGNTVCQSKHRKNDGLPVVIFKLEFSDQLRELKLLPAIAKLIGDLRKEVGDDFLEGARTIVAHPVQQNTFVRTYRHCFLPRR